MPEKAAFRFLMLSRKPVRSSRPHMNNPAYYDSVVVLEKSGFRIRLNKTTPNAPIPFNQRKPMVETLFIKENTKPGEFPSAGSCSTINGHKKDTMI